MLCSPLHRSYLKYLLLFFPPITEMSLNLRELPAVPWPAQAISNSVLMRKEQRSLIKYMPITHLVLLGQTGRTEVQALQLVPVITSQQHVVYLQQTQYSFPHSCLNLSNSLQRKTLLLTANAQFLLAAISDYLFTHLPAVIRNLRVP